MIKQLRYSIQQANRICVIAIESLSYTKGERQSGKGVERRGEIYALHFNSHIGNSRFSRKFAKLMSTIQFMRSEGRSWGRAKSLQTQFDGRRRKFLPSSIAFCDSQRLSLHVKSLSLEVAPLWVTFSYCSW